MQMVQLADAFFNPTAYAPENRHYFVARQENGGIIGIHCSHEDTSRNVMTQEITLVDPNHGDNRIGCRLSESAIERARERGVASIEAIVGEENTSALRLSRSLGFQEIDRKDHSVIMAFNLGRPGRCRRRNLPVFYSWHPNNPCKKI